MFTTLDNIATSVILRNASQPTCIPCGKWWRIKRNYSNMITNHLQHFSRMFQGSINAPRHTCKLADWYFFIVLPSHLIIIVASLFVSFFTMSRWFRLKRCSPFFPVFPFVRLASSSSFFVSFAFYFIVIGRAHTVMFNSRTKWLCKNIFLAYTLNTNINSTKAPKPKNETKWIKRRKKKRFLKRSVNCKGTTQQ